MGDEEAPVRRPGGRTARLRERMLAATTELVAQHGIVGLRYEDVAERAGVNKTSVYRNWPDRARLVTDALASFADDTAPLRDTGDLDADLVDFVEAVAAAMSTPRGQALLAVTTAARDHPELRAIVDEVREHRWDVLGRRLQAAVERGELPPVERAFLAEMLTGPVQQFLARGDRAFTRADAARVTAVVLAGVRATHDGCPGGPHHPRTVSPAGVGRAGFMIGGRTIRAWTSARPSDPSPRATRRRVPWSTS